MCFPNARVKSIFTYDVHSAYVSRKIKFGAS